MIPHYKFQSFDVSIRLQCCRASRSPTHPPSLRPSSLPFFLHSFGNLFTSQKQVFLTLHLLHSIPLTFRKFQFTWASCSSIVRNIYQPISWRAIQTTSVKALSRHVKTSFQTRIHPYVEAIANDHTVTHASHCCLSHYLTVGAHGWMAYFIMNLFKLNLSFKLRFVKRYGSNKSRQDRIYSRSSTKNVI
jgi:hypothetical protein